MKQTCNQVLTHNAGSLKMARAGAHAECGTAVYLEEVRGLMLVAPLFKLWVRVDHHAPTHSRNSKELYVIA